MVRYRAFCFIALLTTGCFFVGCEGEKGTTSGTSSTPASTTDGDGDGAAATTPAADSNAAKPGSGNK